MVLEEKGKNNRIKNIIVGFLFVCAIILIGFGIYFNILSTGKNITGSTIDKLSYLFKNYFDKSNNLEFGNNFTIESDVDLNIKSEYHTSQSSINLDSLNIVKKLNNLTNMDIKTVYKQSLKDKKVLASFSSKINEEELLNFKYLVENSTGYYFVDGFLDNYVNNGSCNYFESLDAENSTEENIKYLYEFVIASLKDNLKEDYFKKSVTETNILGEKTETNLVSIRIDDKIYKEILKGVLKDLKSDERANKILTSIDKDFSKAKIRDNTTYIKNNASYTFNIYTSKFFNKFLKIELVHLDGDSRDSITYEGNENDGNIYFSDKEKVNFIIECKFNENKYEFRIKDSVEKEFGSLKLEFDSKSKSINFIFEEDSVKLDLLYVSKNIGKESKNNYTNEQKLTFKYAENKISKYDGDVIITSKVSREAVINEDISNAVLKSTLTDQQKEVLNNKFLTVKERIAGDK